MEKLYQYSSKSCLKMAGVGWMHPPHPPVALITMSLTTTPNSRFGFSMMRGKFCHSCFERTAGIYCTCTVWTLHFKNKGLVSKRGVFNSLNSTPLGAPLGHPHSALLLSTTLQLGRVLQTAKLPHPITNLIAGPQFFIVKSIDAYFIRKNKHMHKKKIFNIRKLLFHRKFPVTKVRILWLRNRKRPLPVLLNTAKDDKKPQIDVLNTTKSDKGP